MIFILFAVLTIVATRAEDLQNEISSSDMLERSTDKGIQAREYIEKPIAMPRSGPPPMPRRNRYMQRVSRPRRRLPFEPRTMRRPNNNFPNLYGPRSRFKPTAPYRSMPPKSRYRYRDNWRYNKWSEPGKPIIIEEDEILDQESPPYEEYDEIEDYKGDEQWYPGKKYREVYEDSVPSLSKYNEKRSPSRYLSSYANIDYPRKKVRAHFDVYDHIRKDPSEWTERNRFSKNYNNIIEILSPSQKYEEEEVTPPMHRFKASNWNRYKQLDDEEYNFSSNDNLKSRRFKASEPTVIVGRRPSAIEEPRYEHDMTDLSKYLTTVQAIMPSKESAQETVYSAKYKGHEAEKNGEKSKLKNEDTQTESNILHDWKRTQKQSDFQGQFSPSNKVTSNYDRSSASDVNVNRNQNYKNDNLLPSELITYMSANPGESVVGKEERYLQAAYPFMEKYTNHDILKTTFPRKISPIVDQDLEITFDDRMGDWKR